MAFAALCGFSRAREWRGHSCPGFGRVDGVLVVLLDPLRAAEETDQEGDLVAPLLGDHELAGAHAISALQAVIAPRSLGDGDPWTGTGRGHQVAGGEMNGADVVAGVALYAGTRLVTEMDSEPPGR